MERPDTPAPEAGTFHPAAMPWGWSLVVATLALLGLLWALGAAPLAGTEAHRALPAAEMATGGTWAAPHLFGEVYLRKPPMHLWLVAAVQSVTGVGNEFIWRLPSAVMAALTAGVVTLLAGRWFGRHAGVAAGFCCMGLVALWGQSRTADIDATNTFFSVAAALVFIELYRADAGRRWPWLLAAGLLAAGSLLTKFHAGLPTMLGGILGPVAVVWLHRRRGGTDVRPGHGVLLCLLGLLIGAALFAAWLGGAWLALGDRLLEDLSGVTEAQNQAVADGFTHLLEALALPPMLFAFALPVSAGLVLAFHPNLRRLLTPATRFTLDASVAAFIIAMLVGLAAGMTNPRYGYVALPLAAVPAGVCIESWRRGTLDARGRRTVAVATACCLAAAGVALLVLARPEPLAAHAVVTGMMFIAGFTLVLRQRGEAMAAGVVVLLLAVMVRFGDLRAIDRADRSGYAAAQELREKLPQGVELGSRRLLWSKPEFVHYSGVTLVHLGRPAWQDPHGTPEPPARPMWLALLPEELDAWPAEARSRLTQRFELSVGGKETIVGFYEP